MLSFRFLLLFHVTVILVAGRKHRVSNDSNRVPVCECGVQKGGPVDTRIVGGQPVPEQKYPWMAAILYNKFFNCGGSIINDRYILTAGHCVYGMKPEEILVIVGTHKLGSGLGVRIMAEELLLHENYIRENLHDINDIGLIRLKEKINFTEHVSPICLPVSDVKNYAGEFAYVAGWGRIGESLPISKDMLHVQLTVLSQEECKNASFGALITEGMICTYTENKDACQGDSGGPLIYSAPDGKNELIGLISWGLGCAAPDMPGVYTRVQAYLPWILENTKTANYCLRAYIASGRSYFNNKTERLPVFISFFDARNPPQRAHCYKQDGIRIRINEIRGNGAGRKRCRKHRDQ